MSKRVDRGAGNFSRSTLLLTCVGKEQTLEIGGGDGGQPRPQRRFVRAGSLRLRRATFDRIIGDELVPPGLGRESRDGGLRNFRGFRAAPIRFRSIDAIAAQLHLSVDAPEIFDLAVRVDAAEIAAAIDAARRIVGEREEIGMNFAAFNSGRLR